MICSCYVVQSTRSTGPAPVAPLSFAAEYEARLAAAVEDIEPGVVDADAADFNNPAAVSDYVRSIYQHYKTEEVCDTDTTEHIGWYHTVQP